MLRQCKSHALHFNVNYEDLLSNSMYRTAIAIRNKIEINDIEHAFRTVKTIVINQCKDIKRTPYAQRTEFVDNETFELRFDKNVQPTDDRETFKILDKAIRLQWQDKPNYIEIYEKCILGHEHQDKLAEELGINGNTLRGAIRYIQTFARKTAALL